MKRKGSLSAIVWISVISTLAAGPAQQFSVAPDQVSMPGADPVHNAVMVDGSLGGHQNDVVYTDADGATGGTQFPTIQLDNFTESPVSNEVIGFSSGNPPMLKEDVLWTSAANTVNLPFADPYRIPVHVWIVNGPFEETRARAIEDGIEASMIWQSERQGIEFSSFVIRDATTRPAASRFTNLDCPDARWLRRGIGARTGAINVYYSTKVVINGEPTRFGARWCPDQRMILMGEGAFGALFAHELGHAFGLRHVDQFPLWFDDTNVMAGSSSNRTYLTEGQTFRAVFNPLSVINTYFWLRLGQPMRYCATSTDTNNARCPAIQTRIWPDGDWPAN